MSGVRIEAVILIGIQGSGKSTFYQQRFAASHQRLNLDSMKTRHREAEALRECVAKRMSFVVDNTNVTVAGRERYVAPAKAAGYRVIGYMFEPIVADCVTRNELRQGKAKVPKPALFGTLKRLQRPRFAEGFDELHTVHLRDEEFVVEPYTEPAEATLKSP